MILYPKFQAFDNNGNFLAGGKVYVYDALTDAEVTTYSDAGLTEENTWPVVLNARGEAFIYAANGLLKLIIKDASDSLINTIDEVSSSQVSDSDVVFTDVTTGNTSASKHGYAPKLSGVSTEYFNGVGGWGEINIADAWLAPSGDDDLEQIEAAIAADGIALLGPGAFSISDTINITTPALIKGVGSNLTTITQTDTSKKIISINTLLPVHLQNFTCLHSSQADNGVDSIYVTCPDGGAGVYGNSSSIFENISIWNAYNGINLANACYWVMRDLKMMVSHTGMTLQNTRYIDSGDNVVDSCIIMSASSGAYSGITWTGGGCTKIVNSKVLSTDLDHMFDYGILFLMPDGGNTRQIVIANNSLDGFNISAVSFWPVGATAYFGGIMISNNIFNLAHIGISAPLPPMGKWITTLNDTGNNWHDNAANNGYYADFGAVISYSSIGHTVG